MEFNTFLIGLLICFLLSFILGIERQVRRRFIGLRTMILVAIGSYIFVSFSFLVTGYVSDVTRVAAQVVAGIGFLGAGVIIKDNEKNKIRGLTTAATLWCDAGIGILCAGGFIKEAVVASLLVLFSNVILRYINSFVNNRLEEMAIDETFLIIFSLKDIEQTNKAMNYITNYMQKDDSLEFLNYEVFDNSIKFNAIVKKNDDKKIDKFVNKIATEFNISKYEYKKINEEKIIEDNDEL